MQVYSWLLLLLLVCVSVLSAQEEMCAHTPTPQPRQHK